MSLVGLDVGTTGVKAVAFDTEGRELAKAYQEYPLLFPQRGWLELDSRKVWSACEDVLLAVTTELKTKDPIVALAISSQGEGVTPIDQHGQPLAHTMVSFDARTAEMPEWWRERFSEAELFRRTGMSLHGIFTINKILWWKLNQPDIFRRAAKFLCYEDFVIQKLGLEPAIDYSLAARTMAWNLDTLKWDEEILAAVGLGPERLASPVPSGTPVGSIKLPSRNPLSVLNGVIVATGGHDQPCGALGAGIVQPGRAMYATGTVECIAPALSERPRDLEQLRRNNLCFYPHAAPGLFLTLMYNFTGGSLLRWYRDTLGQWEKFVAQQEARDPYDVILADLPVEPTPLIVVPHFTMTGTPHFSHVAKGSWLGLSLDTTKAQLTKSILEGVTYEMRYNVDLFRQAGGRIDTFRAIGGGAKAEVWLQIKADILNAPVESMQVSEAACLGAALLAGAAAGVYADLLKTVEEIVRPLKCFVPDPKHAELYEERMNIYRQLQDILAPIELKLSNLDRKT